MNAYPDLTFTPAATAALRSLGEALTVRATLDSRGLPDGLLALPCARRGNLLRRLDATDLAAVRQVINPLRRGYRDTMAALGHDLDSAEYGLGIERESVYCDSGEFPLFIFNDFNVVLPVTLQQCIEQPGLPPLLKRLAEEACLIGWGEMEGACFLEDTLADARAARAAGKAPDAILEDLEEDYPAGHYLASLGLLDVLAGRDTSQCPDQLTDVFNVFSRADNIDRGPLVECLDPALLVDPLAHRIARFLDDAPGTPITSLITPADEGYQFWASSMLGITGTEPCLQDHYEGAMNAGDINGAPLPWLYTSPPAGEAEAVGAALARMVMGRYLVSRWADLLDDSP